jgi:hypothetical protein
MTIHNGDREYATVRDRDDPLTGFRRRFYIPLTETGRTVFEEVHVCVRAFQPLLRTNA